MLAGGVIVQVPVVVDGITLNFSGFCKSTSTDEPLHNVSAINVACGQLQSLTITSTMAVSGVHGAVAEVVYINLSVSKAIPATSTTGKVPPGVAPAICVQTPGEGSVRLLNKVFKSTETGPAPIS